MTIRSVLEFTKKLDEHGEVRESIKLDKTTTIQEFIDFLEDFVPHPDHPHNEEYTRTRFMIPNHPDSRAQLDFIFEDWTSLYRTDLPETLEEDATDQRIFARKKFSHPSDSLMACIYALKSSRIKNYWNYVGV